MLLPIYTIVNKPISSNCHIVCGSNDECIIIDPGSEDIVVYEQYLNDNHIVPIYIILTHEHFDHIWGVNKLRENYPGIRLICSEVCSERIQYKKKNYSLFFNGVGFEIGKADITLTEPISSMVWNNCDIRFIITQGHSEGSICIYFSELNVLFTGDTIIYGEKTVTKLKGGDINQLNQTLELLKRLFSARNPLLLTGHGESFYFNHIL